MAPAPVFPLYPCFSSASPVFLVRWIREGYGADTGGTGEEYGEWVLVRIRAQREGMGSTSGIPLSSSATVITSASVYPSVVSFFFLPLSSCGIPFLSLVILLLPCIPCLSPASSHPPIHSFIRLHGYPFALTDNRLTGPHTLRYAITRK